MNRRTRTMIVVGLAVALAGLASFGVFQTIKRLPVKEIQIAERYTVVATKPVPVGVLLTPDMVRVVPWPANAPVTGGFTDVKDVVGRGVTAGFVVNEPVVDSKLAPKASGGGLPPSITPGMRAMSVKVNEVIGVSGFTVRGTRVDVIATLRGQESMSRTVISNVEVLAAGTNIDAEKSREGKPIPSSVVTLLLTPADAERLALAMEQGQIVLALRNPLDVAKTETTGVRLSALMGSLNSEPAKPVARGPRQAAPAPPPPPPPAKTVTGIRGSKVTQEIIKK